MLHLIDRHPRTVHGAPMHEAGAVMEMMLCSGRSRCVSGGPAVQGLWHPARKVREVYWKIYNNLYIGAQDSLVAFYPRLEEDGMNDYTRRELDIFL